MAKKKRKRKRTGSHTVQALPAIEDLVPQLEQQVENLKAAEDSDAGAIWGQTHKLLLNTSVEAREVARIIASRNLPALRRLVEVLANNEDPTTLAEAAIPVAEVPTETMKKAMQAFRKRMKLTMLDAESKLGVGPMTGGRRADIDAILPPWEFDSDVWEALVAEGKLRSAGGGFYMLGKS